MHVWVQDPVSKKWMQSGRVIAIGERRSYDVRLSNGRIWREEPEVPGAKSYPIQRRMHVFINSRLINFFHVIVSVITSSVRWTTWTENFENKKGVRRWPQRPPKLHQAIDNGPQCRQIWTDQSRHRTWIRTGQSGHRTRCLSKSRLPATKRTNLSMRTRSNCGVNWFTWARRRKRWRWHWHCANWIWKTGKRSTEWNW